MAERPPSMLRHELSALRRSLAEANDSKVMHIVGVLDEMAAGAAADHLIDPVRPRLVKLRPARRLRFARLLFAPLDALIVPARQWKPGTPTIPRTVLEPLARTLRAALGPAVEPIDAAIAGRTTRDAAAVTRAGGLLWPLAADILTDPPPPIDWAETGLKQGAYAPLAHAAGAVLARLPQLQELERDADNGIQPLAEAIEAILDGIAAETPQAQGMTVTLLLARLPQAGPVVRRRADSNAVLRYAEGQAIAALIDGLENTGAIEVQVLGTELAESASEVRRIAALLGVLEGDPPAPERRGRLLALGHRLDGHRLPGAVRRRPGQRVPGAVAEATSRRACDAGRAGERGASVARAGDGGKAARRRRHL